MKSILTVMPEGPAYELASAEFELHGITDFNVCLSDAAQIDNLCDDTAFAHSIPKFTNIADDDALTGGMLMHPGMKCDGDESESKSWEQRPNTCPSQAEWITMRSNAKESQRKAAAILVRVITIMAMIINAGKDVDWPLVASRSMRR